MPSHRDARAGRHLFYAGCFFWTIGCGISTRIDKEDDILIGVKSAAIRLGARTALTPHLLRTAFALMLAADRSGLRLVFVAAMLVAGAHLLWQLRTLDIDRPLLCLRLFKSNRDTGALIAAALVLGSIAGV
jgi:4-hydroxybenzoate polyprenyltransferase